MYRKNIKIGTIDMQNKVDTNCQELVQIGSNIMLSD